jgi:cbb3-type cytochrome oxidase subunit 3
MNSVIFMGLIMLIFFLGVLAYVVWDEKRQKTKSK